MLRTQTSVDIADIGPTSAKARQFDACTNIERGKHQLIPDSKNLHTYVCNRISSIFSGGDCSISNSSIIVQQYRKTENTC